MKKIKPGIFPSTMRLLGGIIVVIFLIVFLNTAVEEKAPTQFIVFITLALVISIGGVIYHFYNASSPSEDRITEYDIASSEKNIPSSDVPAQKETVESRLDKLEHLYQQGIISESEYLAQRQRVIESL